MHSLTIVMLLMLVNRGAPNEVKYNSTLSNLLSPSRSSPEEDSSSSYSDTLGSSSYSSSYEGDATPHLDFGPDWDVRLWAGEFANEGRLEIRPPEGEWGTVCGVNNSAFSRGCGAPELQDVCHQLGFLAPYRLDMDGARFGMADGPIWSEGFVCPSQPGRSCRLAPWTGNDTSNCCHRSDLSLTCVTDNFRLSAGCSSREGRVEVFLGAAGWARLTRCSDYPRHATDLFADRMCQYLGHPLAIGSVGTCKVGPADLNLLSVRSELCPTHFKNPRECFKVALRSSCLQKDPSCIAGDVEVVCAKEDEVLSTSLNFTDVFNVRLVNGTNRLSGILELRHLAFGWAPACFYDTGGIHDIASRVCRQLDSHCFIESSLTDLVNRSEGLEYILRNPPRSQPVWLRGQDQCLRQKGYNLKVVCSLDITINGTTVSLYPNQTCEGRCGEPSSPDQCGCDIMCHVFQECCYDVDSNCPIFYADTNASHNILNLSTRSHYYQCVEFGRASSYRLISTCPGAWKEDDVRHQCQSELQPVLYRPLDIPFKNPKCAICHGIAQNQSLVPVDDSAAFVAIVDPDLGGKLQPCKQLIGSCDNGGSDGVRDACRNYMAPVGKHKNPHCNLCQNHVNQTRDSSVCFRITLSSSAHFLHTTLISQPVKVRVVNNQYFQSFGPNTEIVCNKRQYFLEVNGQDTQEGSRDILSEQRLMECLISAISLPSLSRASLTSSPVKRRLVLKLGGERLNYTVLPLVSTPSDMSNMEEILDRILRVDGNLSRTNWADRCNLSEVVLRDECLLAPHFPDSFDNIECFSVGDGKWKTVTIDRDLFVYIMNTNELVAPTDISNSTSYIVHTENSSKLKLLRFCGKRANNFMCEVRNPNDMHVNDTPNQEAELTLPNGEHLICFPKSSQWASWDPFSDPELIINVVGFSLSMAGLMATLLTYCVFSSLRNVHGLAIINLSLAIFLGQLLSTLSSVVITPSHQGLCSAVAVATHYGWLSMFAWMAAVSWDFMQTFSSNQPAHTKHSDGRKFLRMFLLGWFSPMLVVIPNVVLFFCDCTRVDFSYGDDVACWMTGTFKLAVLCAPILACICFNAVCFVGTVRSIRASKKATAILNKNSSRGQPVWREVVVYAKISSLLSFTWILGFIAMATELRLFWYAFTIFTSLQGFFVFLSFALNGQVRALWSGKISKLVTSMCAFTSQSSTSSPPSERPQPQTVGQALSDT